MGKTKQREYFEGPSAEQVVRFNEWWLKPENSELRKSCALGWGVYIWLAAQKAALASIEIERPGTTCIGWVKEAINEHDDKWIEAIKAAGLRMKT